MIPNAGDHGTDVNKDATPTVTKPQKGFVLFVLFITPSQIQVALRPMCDAGADVDVTVGESYH